MILAVLASDSQKEEMANSAFFQKYETVFSENHSLWPNHSADAFIDLSNETSAARTQALAALHPKPVLINSVSDTLDRLHSNFIRINGWPGFLKGNLLEAAGSVTSRQAAEKVFGADVVFVKDEPGFVSARIVAMIINEAFFTWESGVSSKAEIDQAMKLGTGYPYGPFEWCELIGIRNVSRLLQRLSEKDKLYELAENLKADQPDRSAL